MPAEFTNHVSVLDNRNEHMLEVGRPKARKGKKYSRRPNGIVTVL